MPYAKVPAFVVRLTERESFSRLALQFAILTAVRSGEVRGAAWEEFDLDEKLWRSEEHTYELQSLMRISYAVFCLKKKKIKYTKKNEHETNNNRRHTNDQMI